MNVTNLFWCLQSSGDLLADRTAGALRPIGVQHEPQLGRRVTTEVMHNSRLDERPLNPAQLFN